MQHPTSTAWGRGMACCRPRLLPPHPCIHYTTVTTHAANTTRLREWLGSRTILTLCPKVRVRRKPPFFFGADRSIMNQGQWATFWVSLKTLFLHCSLVARKMSQYNKMLYRDIFLATRLVWFSGKSNVVPNVLSIVPLFLLTDSKELP